MKPGETTRPRASITVRPRRLSVVIALMVPLDMPRLRIASVRDSGSITLPLRMTRSNDICELEKAGINSAVMINKTGPIGPIGPVLINAPFRVLQRARTSPPDHLALHKSHRAG